MNPTEIVGPVAEDIRGAAAEAERERQLPAYLMSRLRGQGLFSIYTPRAFGGMELPLPDALRVVEEVSRHDGSTGWTVALGVANDFFLSALPEESVRMILNGGSALIAGAPGPEVRALAVDGGYRLSGRWPFNSGSWNADWLSVAAVIFDGEAPRMGEFGPEMTFAVFHPSDAEIIDTWQVTGLRGTSTHDLQVDDLFVPAEMAGGFSLATGPKAVRDSVLARFPLFTLLGIAQSPPVCLGLARHALDCFRQLALAKVTPFNGRLSEQVQAQAGLARAEAALRSARGYWYDTVQRAWDCARAGHELGLDLRAELRMASLHAVEGSVCAADWAVRLSGTTGIFQTQEIERCWRDLHTAAQHLQVQDARWETAGRVLFGLEPASPIF